MSGLGIIMMPQEAHFTLQDDLYRSIGLSTSFPIIQSPTSNIYVALKEIMLFPHHVTDERLYTVNSICFRSEDSAHQMRSDLNKQYRKFKIHLLDRGVQEKKLKYYEEIVQGLKESHLDGYDDKLIVKGKKCDGKMDDKNFLTTMVKFYVPIPHLSGLYTPPILNKKPTHKTSATPEETRIS